MERDFNINNIIDAANYEEFCDFSIIFAENKFFNEDILKKDCVIFCKTDHINYLFENIKNSDKKYKIITHHSDYPIDTNLFRNIPQSVEKWYGINTAHSDERLVTIPIGLKTHSGIFTEEKYQTQWFSENINSLYDADKNNIVYCNWCITNRNRIYIINQIVNKNISFVHENNLPFKDYIYNMSKCKFVISPPGNGIDCHRTWEALYVGCIPIVITDKIYDNFKELPILQIDNYQDINMDMLLYFWDKNKNKNSDMLNINYWKKIITNND